jgi:hypothetical protein
MVKCACCKERISKESGPFPVIQHGKKPQYFCDQECMGHVWPDAAPKISLGDMFSASFMGFVNPRTMAELSLKENEYAPLFANEDEGGGYTYLSICDLEGEEEPLPHDEWAILLVHPNHDDTFFVVPWSGDEEHYKRAEEHDNKEDPNEDLTWDSCDYVAVPAQSLHVSWEYGESGPNPVWLFLGRGKWIRVKDMELHARHYKLTPESLEEARKRCCQMFGGK